MIRTLIATVALAACSANPVPETMPMPDELADARLAPIETRGLVREVYGPTPCEGNYNPMLRWKAGRAAESHWLLLHGTTNQVQEVPTWLLVSFEPMLEPTPWQDFEMPGCWQLVNYDEDTTMLLGPRREPPAHAQFGAWQEGSDVFVLWWPRPGTSGGRMYLQLLVAAPGGFRSSNALEVMVGR